MGGYRRTICLITGDLRILLRHHQMAFRRRCEWRPRDEGRVYRRFHETRRCKPVCRNLVLEYPMTSDDAYY